MKALIKSMWVSLILILFVTPSLMAGEIPLNLQPMMVVAQQPMPTPDTSLAPQASPKAPTPIKKPAVASKTCLGPDAMSALAAREKHCQKCDLDLKTMTDAYNAQNAQLQQPVSFIKKPAVVAGGTAVVIIVSCLLLHCQF